MRDRIIRQEKEKEDRRGKTERGRIRRRKRNMRNLKFALSNHSSNTQCVAVGQGIQSSRVDYGTKKWNSKCLGVYTERKH